MELVKESPIIEMDNYSFSSHSGLHETTVMSGLEEELNQEHIYKQFYRYDFNSNKEYQSGLDQILKQFLILRSETDIEVKKDLSEEKFDFNKIKPEEKQQLTLQAKVFFFCSQTGNILELDDYKKWESTYKPDEEPTAISSTAPPYSSNYEELVDLIVNNKPIPGIKQIPNVTLDPTTASKHQLKERRKPWEKQAEENRPEA